MSTDRAALLISVIWLVFYVSACAVPHWRECRRIHPMWYCAMEP